MFARDIKFQKDKVLLKYKNYEDYLDSLIRPRDLYHFRSKLLARKIIELGYHTPGTMTRKTFNEKVKNIRRYMFLKEHPYTSCSESLNLKDNLLNELAIRESANRYGQMYTIIFIRNLGKIQSQISGHIDYSHRLQSEDWLPYFENTKLISPTKSDLSFYHWKSRKAVYNDSVNFKPILIGKKGLGFQNIHTSTSFMLNSELNLNTNPARKVVYSDIYGRVILYDQIVWMDESEGKE